MGLISYLVDRCLHESWSVTLADYNFGQVEEKARLSSAFRAVRLDVRKHEQLNKLVSESDVVVSLIPAHLHFFVARSCLNYHKPLITASYVSPDIQALDKEAREQGVLLLMEMGLDPGLDHMSAQMEIDRIHALGGEITSFKSFTGGLMAPESDNNPWNYKFTWNPRNVVLAGQGAVKFLRDGKFNYIPYQNLFKRVEKIEVSGLGSFEGYANRDSLKYKDLYGLKDVKTILRGTLRKEGFCEAWDAFVQLGLTDDSYMIEGVEGVAFRDFLEAYLPYREYNDLEEDLRAFLKLEVGSIVLEKLRWIGVFSDFKIPMNSASPAQVLQSLLETKWKLSPDDKDMIVMHHQFEYWVSGVAKKSSSSLVIKGDNAKMTSMAKTVGLPIGLAISEVLKGSWSDLSGVMIPVSERIYSSVLEGLKKYDVNFSLETDDIV